MSMLTLDILRRSPLGHNLSPQQLAAVDALAKRAGFTAGEALTKLNDTDADLYIIGDGRVQFLTHDGDLLGEAGPGGIVGEIAFVDGRHRTAHAVAAGYVDAIRFPARELRALMVRDKELGFMLLANLSIALAHRLRVAIGQLDDLMDLQDDVWTSAI
jgi:CRP/FNR family transcriptional regulator, cyclic AMP receptor protein